MEHIVVIGAGQAGAALVARLRGEGFGGRITLIGAEPFAPYQRPPLSKAYLLGEMERARLFLRPDSFYAEHDIDLHTGVTVHSIDAVAQTVTLGAQTLGYDALALTTGAIPRHLPAAIGGGLRGVHVLRGIADVDALAPAVVEGARLVVIGGGYIGLEAAAVAARRGLDVTVVEMAPRILQRVAAPETSDAMRALHQSHGVRMIEGVGLERLEGAEGRVSAALLSDGQRIAADFVIAGIGVTPETALAESAGCVLRNGIAVDAQGRTSVANIWAAGDCASFPWRGQRIRLESVQNAIDQAEAVARNMLGAEAVYDPVPWFWSDQYDLKLQIAGLGTGYDRIVVRRAGEGIAGRSHWYFDADRLLAVDALSDSRAYMVGKRLLEMGRSPDPAVLADPATDLKKLLK